MNAETQGAYAVTFVIVFANREEVKPVSSQNAKPAADAKTLLAPRTGRRPAVCYIESRRQPRRRSVRVMSPAVLTLELLNRLPELERLQDAVADFGRSCRLPDDCL